MGTMYSNQGHVTNLWEKAQQVGMTRRKFLTLLAAGGATAVLAACTKAVGTSTTTTTGAPPTSTPAKPSSTAASTSKPLPLSTMPPAPSTTSEPTGPPADFKKGGLLRIAQADEPAKFGVPWSTGGQDEYICAEVCEPLIAGTELPGVYKPVLAESWELAPDKSSYTFHLRKGIVFTDGTPFDAKAVAWGWQKRAEYSPTSFAAGPVKDWTIIDDYTIRSNLNYWTTTVIQGYSGVKGTGMYSPTEYDKRGYDYCVKSPVGTGPYMFKEYSFGQTIKLVRNPQYWQNNGTPWLDEVNWLTQKDSMVAQMGLRRGDFEVWRGLDVDSANTIKALPGMAVDKVGVQNWILYYNGQDPASCWSKLKMRQALEYAIDKQKLCDSFGKGWYIPCYEQMVGIDTIGKSLVTPRKYDLAKAKQLMAESGYSAGVKCVCKIDSNNQIPAVLSLQGMLAEAGIKLDFLPLQGSAWADLNKISPEPNELRVERQRGGPATIVPQTNGDFGRLSMNFVNRPVPDGWFDKMDLLLQETDRAKVIALLEDLNKIAYDAVMILPIFSSLNPIAFVSNLKQYIPAGTLPQINMSGPFTLGNAYSVRAEWLYFAKK